MKDILKRAKELLKDSNIAEFEIDKGRTVYINLVEENDKRVISAVEVSDGKREYPEIEDYLFNKLRL